MGKNDIGVKKKGYSNYEEYYYIYDYILDVFDEYIIDNNYTNDSEVKFAFEKIEILFKKLIDNKIITDNVLLVFYDFYLDFMKIIKEESSMLEFTFKKHMYEMCDIIISKAEEYGEFEICANFYNFNKKIKMI